MKRLTRTSITLATTAVVALGSYEVLNSDGHSHEVRAVRDCAKKIGPMGLQLAKNETAADFKSACLDGYITDSPSLVTNPTTHTQAISYPLPTSAANYLAKALPIAEAQDGSYNNTEKFDLMLGLLALEVGAVAFYGMTEPEEESRPAGAVAVA